MPLRYDPDQIKHTPGRTPNGVGDWSMPIYTKENEYVLTIHGRSQVDVIQKAQFLLDCATAARVEKRHPNE